MSLSIYRHSNIFNSVNGMGLNAAVQASQIGKGLAIDYSVSENRLHRHSDGSIEVTPYTPYEVIGRQVIRPLLNATYDLSCRTFQVLRAGFSAMDTIFSKALNFIPGVKADSSTDEDTALEVADSTVIVGNGDLCSPLQAIQNAVQANQLMIAYPNLPQLEPPSEDALDHADDNFSSVEDAVKYLQVKMGRPILMPKPHCLAENSINQIKKIKAPNFVQKEDLMRAYAELQELAHADMLAPCQQRLMELFGEIGINSRSYSIEVLQALPELFKSLLRMTGRNFILADLNLLVAKVNEISGQMAVAFQETNDRGTLFRCFDVMLESAERNPHLLVFSFETVRGVFQRDIGNTIEGTLRERIRKIAMRYTRNPLTQQEQIAVDKILEMTRSMWPIDLVYDCLEDIQYQIRRFSQLIEDIQSTLLQSSGFQQLTILIGTGILSSYAPARLRRPILFAGLALTLSRILYGLRQER